jgi:MSHA pilin protein MshD
MNKKGFTLIELVIYILIFAVGVTTIMTMMPQILTKNADSILRLRGIQVAQAAMEKILAKKWDETTPNGGGATSTPSAFGIDTGENSMQKYDDIDDFNALSNEVSNDTNGFNLTAGYTIDVDISYVNMAGGTFTAVAGTSHYKQIKVTVHSTSLAETYDMYAVKGNF